MGEGAAQQCSDPTQGTAEVQLIEIRRHQKRLHLDVLDCQHATTQIGHRWRADDAGKHAQAGGEQPATGVASAQHACSRRLRGRAADAAVAQAGDEAGAGTSTAFPGPWHRTVNPPAPPAHGEGGMQRGDVAVPDQHRALTLP